MNRSLTLVVGLLLATCAGIALTAEYPLNALSKFRGKTSDRWSVIAAENSVKQFLGLGGTPNLTIKKVRFLPEVPPPDSVGNIVEFDIVAKPGTAFCVPASETQRELYDSGFVEDPFNPNYETVIYPTTLVTTILYGEVLLNGTVSDSPEYSYGPTFF